MTTYELAKTIDEATRKRMTAAGILPTSLTRYMYIYEMYCERIAAGDKVMDAYMYCSFHCHTAESNIRKIIMFMRQPA